MTRFFFAIEHHIPVLPLLLDPGLEERFNQRCGDLQFLDPYAQDSTTLSFEEKLKQFLDRVLVGDALAESIRAAFDGYLFLSYRKKDRKYAQELMRLIHEKDACRDLAIWYDEYLTPGENFNAAILDAVKKSRLFLLTVTPNLVNETNYVMTEEYPFARSLSKPILPVEMAATDRTLLEWHFEAIPPCINPKAPAELAQKLDQLLGGTVVRQNDAKHDYLIGMAYLNGVDVEVDHARAVRLITSSAESGLIDAIGQLAKMYDNGIGVPRDYKRSIHWQQEKIRRLEEQYHSQMDDTLLHSLVSALWECAGKYASLGQFDAAKEVCLHGVELIRSKTDNNIWQRQDLVYGLGKLGEYCAQAMQLPESRQWFEQVLEVLRPLAEESGNACDLQNLGALHHNLGLCCEREGKLAEARQQHEQGYAILADLAKTTPSPPVYRALMSSYNHMGKICLAQKDMKSARYWFEQGESIGRVLYAETNSDAACRDLIVLCHNLGYIWELEGDPVRARNWYERHLELTQALAQKTDLLPDRQNLAVSYRNLGSIAVMAGDHAQANVWYERGLATLRALEKDNGEELLRTELWRILHLMGNLHKAEGNHAAARARYTEALEYMFALANQAHSEQAWYYVCVSYNALGDIYWLDADLENARYWFGQTYRIIPVVAAHTDQPNDQALLAETCLRLGLTTTIPEERDGYLRRAADIWTSLHREYPETAQYASSLQTVYKYLK